MKNENMRVGDIIKFKLGNDMFIGRINAKGIKFLPNTTSNVIYISVLEHPEWKDVTIEADKVVEIIITPEVVHFT